MFKTTLSALAVFVLLILSCKQNQSNTSSGNKTGFLISMDGIDSLKFEMPKNELEKLLNTTFTFKHIGVDGGMTDTFQVKYKGIDMIIQLKESDSAAIARLDGISTENSACKTSNGIGVGSDKLKVIEEYQYFTKYVAPVYETYPVRSKTRSVVAVTDSATTHAIQFYIENKKVVGIEVNTYYEYY